MDLNNRKIKKSSTLNRDASANIMYEKRGKQLRVVLVFHGDLIKRQQLPSCQGKSAATTVVRPSIIYCTTYIGTELLLHRGLSSYQ